MLSTTNRRQIKPCRDYLLAACHSERSEESLHWPTKMPRPFVALRVTAWGHSQTSDDDVCGTRAIIMRYLNDCSNDRGSRLSRSTDSAALGVVNWPGRYAPRRLACAVSLFSGRCSLPANPVLQAGSDHCQEKKRRVASLDVTGSACYS